MDQIPFVDLRSQYATIRHEIDRTIHDVIDQSDFILGSQLESFEQAFSGFIGAAYAIGVGSGFDALRLALAALDIGTGKEVILPANTFIASAMAVSAADARPVLVDCDPGTYMIDVGLIERAITARTAAIMPVHLTGQSADMEPILEIAEQHRLAVVEDAAQAHGTVYKEQFCGAIGTVGCFSFYPSKNLGAYGDGGMITTHSEQLARRLRALRNYGQHEKNHHGEQGGNTRLDTIQAAVLNVKLRYLAAWNSARRTIAEKYRQALTGVGDVTFQQQTRASSHIYHLFIVETHSRDRLRQHLYDQGIQTGVHYPVPIHLQPAFAKLGYKAGDFPHSERLAQRMLSLPMYPEMSDDQIQRVVDAIKSFFK